MSTFNHTLSRRSRCLSDTVITIIYDGRLVRAPKVTIANQLCSYALPNHMYRQVIDTPGILDHSLEERNTIEMQAIIALAHLSCSVLYFVDISEQCGYTVDQQCSLFRSIKPLFANKQLIGTLPFMTYKRRLQYLTSNSSLYQWS